MVGKDGETKEREGGDDGDDGGDGGGGRACGVVRGLEMKYGRRERQSLPLSHQRGRGPYPMPS